MRPHKCPFYGIAAGTDERLLPQVFDFDVIDLAVFPPVRNAVLRSWRRPLRLAREMVELDLQHGDTRQGLVG